VTEYNSPKSFCPSGFLANILGAFVFLIVFRATYLTHLALPGLAVQCFSDASKVSETKGLKMPSE
jgi:hypothetical protein